MRSILVNEIFSSLSNVIQAQGTEFRDKCVSTFPRRSLLTLTFQSIMERHRIFQCTIIFEAMMRQVFFTFH